MNIKNSLLITLIIFAVSCGNERDNSFYISGSVDTTEIQDQINGPILIAITSSDNLDDIKNNPEDAIIMVAGINEDDMTYNLDLSEYNLSEGDKINIVAFMDSNYSGGMPTPDEDDFIGFYMNTQTMSASYTLKNGNNSGLDIKLNRKIYSYEAEISGTIGGTETGDLTLIAFAGEITSSDFSKLDSNGIVGYHTIYKDTSPINYTMNIMPYGYNVPIEKVHVFAMLDVNMNGEIDSGDRVAYYTGSGSDIPKFITINEGTNPGINIDAFTMDVPKPSGISMSIRGTFSMPYGYDEDSAPMYILIADISDTEKLFSEPMSSIKYFQKMAPGEFYFDIDLSKTDLKPGDVVMITALWDKDHDGGFPNPTPGDKIGFLQNNESYSFTVELETGETPIPREGYDFEVNRIIYDFESSIMFALDKGQINSWIVDRSQIILLSVHVGGVDFSMSSAGDVSVQIDMDYVISAGMIKPPEFDNNPDGSKPDIEYESDMRELKLFPAIYHGIVVYPDSSPPDPLIQGVENQETGEMETAYLFAILDENGNGKMDGNDTIGFYNEAYVVSGGQGIVIPGAGSIPVPDGTYYVPNTINNITKGRNKLLVDDNGTTDDESDDTYNPYWIEFTYYEAP